jgi:hypothetical protein
MTRTEWLKKHYQQQEKQMDTCRHCGGLEHNEFSPGPCFSRGDGWYIITHEGHDLGEGPWTTRTLAREFRDNEVGIASRVVYVSNGRIHEPRN